MVKTALVSTDIDSGLEVVKALELAKVKLNAALWAVLPEYEDWRMVVASREFDKRDFTGARQLLHDAIDPAGFTPHNTPTIKDLRRWYAKINDVEGMRPGGQMIGDRFIEDAYVYRIS